jgi:hypothetical protein
MLYQRMDADLARLQADPAVRAFVTDALLRADGDAEGAAGLMQLRLAQARPEDARVLALVLREALVLAAADEHGAARALRARAAAQRERLAALCERSQAVLDRGRQLRIWATDCRRGFHARRHASSAPGGRCPDAA